MLTKKLFISFFALATLNCNLAQAKLTVVTTTEDLASITRTISGDLANVTAIAKGTQDPHYVEAKPSFLVTLSHADLVVSIGLSLESGWLPLLLRGARRPKLLPGSPGFLAVSEAITPIEVHSSSDRSEGDVHPEGNPHFMADPQRGMAVAAKIEAKLVELDPQNAAKYSENFTRFKADFEKKSALWKKRLAKYKGTKVIGYHKTFNYFFEWTGFEEVGYLEPKPGIPPTAQHILNLVEIAKSKKVKLIMIESFFDPKPGKTLAEKTGAHLVSLPAYVGAEPGTESYIEWFEYLVSHLEETLK